MLWFKKTDPVIQEIVDDLTVVGCVVETPEDLLALEFVPYQALQVVEGWSRRLPPKYTQRMTKLRAALWKKLIPEPPKRTVAELIQEYKDNHPGLTDQAEGPVAYR